MSDGKRLLAMTLLLVCLFGLISCDKKAQQEKEQAIAEANKLRSELQKLKAVLRQTQDERDQLHESMSDALEDLANTKLKLAAAMQAQQQFHNQLVTQDRKLPSGTTENRDAEVTIDELRAQLQEKDALIHELEQLNSQLQNTIQQLQDQLAQTEQQLYEQIEEPNESQEAEETEQTEDTYDSSY